MLSYIRSLFRSGDSDAEIDRYVDDVLKPRFKVDPGTPALIEGQTGPPGQLRRLIDFGRGRSVIGGFYPEDRNGLAAEAASLGRSLAKRKIPAHEVLFDDCSQETRRKYGFDAVVWPNDELRPHTEAWTTEDLMATADWLAKLHAVQSDKGGKPWRPNNPDERYLKQVEKRWSDAMNTVKTNLGRAPNPVKEAPFRERALGWLEGRRKYNLVLGDPSLSNFERPAAGGVRPRDLALCRFGYREWDLALIEHLVFGGPCPAAEQFLDRYFRDQPATGRRRLDELKPFFVGLHWLEETARFAQAARPPKSKSGKKASSGSGPGTAAFQQMSRSTEYQKAVECWQKFLEGAGLPEA